MCWMYGVVRLGVGGASGIITYSIPFPMTIVCASTNDHIKARSLIDRPHHPNPPKQVRSLLKGLGELDDDEEGGGGGGGNKKKEKREGMEAARRALKVCLPGGGAWCWMSVYR